jgi:hypothetical protein
MARLWWVLLLCLPSACAVSFGVTNAPRAPNECSGMPKKPGCSP